MGTHGRRGFKRLLLGSVTETVLREAPCPVLTAPAAAPAVASEAVTFKRILCPVDFSPSALQALGFALDLARQADGLVTLLHVELALFGSTTQQVVRRDACPVLTVRGS